MVRRGTDQPVNNRLRRREVPTRRVGNLLIVARPLDGAPVVMPATAAAVWRQLEGWTTRDLLQEGLREAFPDVPPEEQRDAIRTILLALEADDLLEQS
jgi:hypothetical protein